MITTLNQFKIINEQLENNNFKKWFKNSKVTKNDNPLIVYHGSRSIFNIFKPSKNYGNQGETDQIEGIYFTDSKDGASFFTLTDDEKYLNAVYLSIQNPYIVDNYNDLKKDLNIITLKNVNNILKSKGYDGIIMNKGFYSNGGPYKLFLVFEPNQIKSINNNGTWDVNNNDIYS